MTANWDMSQFVNGHRRTTGHQRTCTVCGKAFAAARPQALYCSPRCKQTVLLRRRHEAGRLHRHRRCPRCGQVFIARRSDGVYCSNACRQAMRRKRAAHGKAEL
jgi:predicted nucleic acid-binding Zn ribbon protein